MLFSTKVVISALIIAGASELGKRSASIGAILVSLPLTSILTLTWLFLETRDVEKVRSLSVGIAWALLPSLIFFLTLPFLLKRGAGYFAALITACSVMSVCYWGYAQL